MLYRLRPGREEADRVAADSYFNTVKSSKENKGKAYLVREVKDVMRGRYLELVMVEKSEVVDGKARGFKEHGKE